MGWKEDIKTIKLELQNMNLGLCVDTQKRALTDRNNTIVKDNMRLYGLLRDVTLENGLLKKENTKLKEEIVTMYKEDGFSDGGDSGSILSNTEIIQDLNSKKTKVRPMETEVMHVSGLDLPLDKLCGGNNSYIHIQLGCGPHKELITTVRENQQNISNGNSTIEQYGKMWGNWIKKNADVRFCNGLYKALKEGV